MEDDLKVVWNKSREKYALRKRVWLTFSVKQNSQVG